MTATAQPPSAAEVCARVQHALAEQRRLVPGPLVRQPAPAAKLAAVLHMSAMDLWDVATEQENTRCGKRPEPSPAES